MWMNMRDKEERGDGSGRSLSDEEELKRDIWRRNLVQEAWTWAKGRLTDEYKAKSKRKSEIPKAWMKDNTNTTNTIMPR